MNFHDRKHDSLHSPAGNAVVTNIFFPFSHIILIYLYVNVTFLLYLLLQLP